MFKDFYKFFRILAKFESMLENIFVFNYIFFFIIIFCLFFAEGTSQNSSTVFPTCWGFS